jgi:hypothetical protein
VSVSLSFFTPSVGLLPWQLPPVHTALAQSGPMTQLLPGAHAAHCEPPQSTSVSSPSFTPSVQLAGGAVHTPPLQSPLWQSVPIVHVAPSPHGLPVRPPQLLPASCETKPPPSDFVFVVPPPSPFGGGFACPSVRAALPSAVVPPPSIELFNDDGPLADVQLAPLTPTRATSTHQLLCVIAAPALRSCLVARCGEDYPRAHPSTDSLRLSS